MQLLKEIQRRRTFAIISHPDAGKTTLTEKLLLFGGAIQEAGAVKNNKIRKTATSDFLEIEKQRGISVATSVMSFEYDGIRINILDTPGHKDFAEDTYRTLTAVDSVILVVDRVKGVEEQTRKLMQVCRLRNTPVMIFINKMDREGKAPLDLLSELEEELNISVSPFTWPAGSGKGFKGVYHLHEKRMQLFAGDKSHLPEFLLETGDIQDPALQEFIGRKTIRALKEELDFAAELFENWDEGLYRSGYLAPVFFGSALNNFGVLELLRTFLAFAPPPGPVETRQRQIRAEEEKFSGFIFKIHANLDPNHRDRIAFLRVCSGQFLRNIQYYHPRLNKRLRFTSPTAFMANAKSTIEEAWPGDVIGLYDNGSLKIGDGLTEGEHLEFKGIPSFSPEILKEAVNLDPFKTKQLEKGVRQLTDEGLAQLFILQPGNIKIIGTVGELQYDVIRYRLEHEYGAKCRFDMMPYIQACWFDGEDQNEMAALLKAKSGDIAFDKEERPVFLVRSEWILRAVKENYPGIRFYNSSEFRNTV